MKIRFTVCAAAVLSVALGVPGSPATDRVRAYVFAQPLRACYPWLFAPNARGARALNHVSRTTARASAPNMEADFNAFTKVHSLSKVSGTAPETGSAATYDSKSRVLLASLGWQEDESTTLLIGNAAPPHDTIARNDLSTFSIDGRRVLGMPQAAIERLYPSHRSVSACGSSVMTFAQDGPGGARFAYVIARGAVVGVFWFGL